MPWLADVLVCSSVIQLVGPSVCPLVGPLVGPLVARSVSDLLGLSVSWSLPWLVLVCQLLHQSSVCLLVTWLAGGSFFGPSVSSFPPSVPHGEFLGISRCMVGVCLVGPFFAWTLPWFIGPLVVLSVSQSVGFVVSLSWSFWSLGQLGFKWPVLLLVGPLGVGYMVAWSLGRLVCRSVHQLSVSVSCGPTINVSWYLSVLVGLSLGQSAPCFVSHWLPCLLVYLFCRITRVVLFHVSYLAPWCDSPLASPSAC